MPGVTPLLQRLLADDPDALSRVASSTGSARVTTLDGGGTPVLCVDGRRLHSTRDPAGEARRFVRGLDLADATVVVLLGFGSGHVVRELAARTDAKLVVFEPDLEALVVGVEHGEVPAHVRVVSSPQRLGELLYARLGGSDRGVIARWTPSVRIAPSLFEAAMQSAAQAVDRASLRHRTALLRGKGWLRHYLENLPALAQTPGLPALQQGMAGVPAIIVAAGPSLDRNLEALRELSEHALVLAVNTAATALGRAGIRPHAVVAIESLDVSPQLRELPWLTEVPAFLELTGNPALWELPFAAKIPISVDTSSCTSFSARIDPAHHLSAGFCVANAATAIAYVLGCNPIILVGSDLAYDGDRVYASGTAFGAMRAEQQSDGIARLSGLEGKRAIEERSGDATGGNRMPELAKTSRVAGWGGRGPVTTTRDFLMFRDWYTSAAQTLAAHGIDAINATEGGAHIPGFRDLALREALPLATVSRSGPSVRQRFDALLTRPPSPRARIVEMVAAEIAAARALLRTASKARATVRNDPDGDLTLDARGAERLRRFGARTRELLHGAPLCAEAVFAPIEELRVRGQVTSFAFYSALEAPLVELAAALARVSQRVLALNVDSSTPAVLAPTG
jgi:Protein of unknown function DUF115